MKVQLQVYTFKAYVEKHIFTTETSERKQSTKPIYSSISSCWLFSAYHNIFFI